MVREFVTRFFGLPKRIAFGVETIHPSFKFSKNGKEVGMKTFGTIFLDPPIRKDYVIKDKGHCDGRGY